MLRFYFTICCSVISFCYFYSRYLWIKKHPDRYSEKQKFSLCMFVIKNVNLKGRIKPLAFGLENLPKDKGYIMYPNHQGRYDALAIISTHKNPCSFVVDYYRSQVLLLNEITDLLGGQRLNKTDPRNQVNCILNVAKEVREGRKYILFPEGGYDDLVTDNSVGEFMPGAFKAAIKSESPIVPVALVDSYKVYLKNSLRKVICEVHYLEPIYFEEYKDMTSKEISNLVKSKIENKINDVLENRKSA